MAQPSGLGKLTSRNWIRGLIVAVVTAVLTVVKSSLEAGGLTFDWKAIAGAGLLAGVSYILLNLSTNNAGELLKKDV